MRRPGGWHPGQTITFAELRDRLAIRHDADGSCPVMTGMNLRTSAEVALADLAEGVPADEVPPVWKLVDPAGPLAPKLPGGAARQLLHH